MYVDVCIAIYAVLIRFWTIKANETGISWWMAIIIPINQEYITCQIQNEQRYHAARMCVCVSMCVVSFLTLQTDVGMQLEIYNHWQWNEQVNYIHFFLLLFSIDRLMDWAWCIWFTIDFDLNLNDIWLK